MERVIHRFRQAIAITRPWIVAAVIVAAGLSFYFAAQGVRYWQAAGNNSSVRDQIGRLERAIGPQIDSDTEQKAQLAAANLELANLHLLFDYPATDTLMSIVSDIAGDVGLDLVSMTAEKVVAQPRGTLQYQVQPISVIIDGPTASVQMFLAILYDRVPVVVASNAKMVNLDTTPSTQLQLQFYLSPEPLPEEGEDTAG